MGVPPACYQYCRCICFYSVIEKKNKISYNIRHRKNITKKIKGGIDMALLEQWQAIAYNEKADRGELQKFWTRYFALEKGVYEKLLSNPDEVVEGTVKELAERFDLELMAMVGFLDGINDSLITPNPIDTMEEDTVVSLAFDKEKLYNLQYCHVRTIICVTALDGLRHQWRDGFLGCFLANVNHSLDSGFV